MSLFRRLFGAAPRPQHASRALNTRAFEAVSPARVGALPTFGQINAEVAAGGPLLRAKARHAAANNPLIAAAVNEFGRVVDYGC